MDLGSSPDSMAKKFFFITVSGVVIYIAAVLLMMTQAEGADPGGPQLERTDAAPVFVASSE